MTISRMLPYCIFGIAVSILSGCSSLDRTYVQVTTKPAGAYLVSSDGRVLGQEPMNLYWLPPQIRSIGPNKWQTGPLTAVWPSGAKMTTTFHYQGKQLQRLNGTIVRNMDDPNLHIDMAHANQVLQLRQQQQMMNQQTMEYLNQSFQTDQIINSLRGIERRLPPPR